jgi:hypothetical protein
MRNSLKQSQKDNDANRKALRAAVKRRGKVKLVRRIPDGSRVPGDQALWAQVQAHAKRAAKPASAATRRGR